MADKLTLTGSIGVFGMILDTREALKNKLGITIDGVPYELHEGESIGMPAGHPHAVYGKEQFKMLLVVVF